MKPELAALARAALGAGDLAGDAVLRGHAEHPVCGDVVEVQVRLSATTIAALAWRARGCPATVATAAAAHAALVGAPSGEARARLRGKLASLGDLAVHERHAESLFLTALERALAGASPASRGSV